MDGNIHLRLQSPNQLLFLPVFFHGDSEYGMSSTATTFAPPLLSSIFQGGFTGKKNFSAQITTNAFSYIRTESGASRSMRVGVMLFNSYEVLFLE